MVPMVPLLRASAITSPQKERLGADVIRRDILRVSGPRKTLVWLHFIVWCVETITVMVVIIRPGPGPGSASLLL